MPFMPLFFAPTMSWLRSPIIRDLRRIDRGLLQRVFQQMRLVDAGAVEFGAEHTLEVIAQAEMVDDAVGEHMRLAGGDEQPVAGRAERCQHLADAVIDAVLVQADIGKSLAIQRHGAVGGRLRRQAV